METLFEPQPNRSPRDCAWEAIKTLGEAIDIYQPSKVFGMLSGGHDSLCACHFASHAKMFAGCVHINTGIGVEETRDYVRQTCKDRGWPLREMRSRITYESLVLRFGFPGPASHGIMYTRLKERCLRQLVRENKTSRQDRIMLVAGMRYDESTRRMGNAETHHRDGCRVWCSPIVNWTTDERNAFIDFRGWEKNPVVAKLCMSGECCCGAFAHPGERAELRFHYPKVITQIEELEAKAKAAGVHCVWGTRPPKQKTDREDTPLFSLCSDCAKR